MTELIVGRIYVHHRGGHYKLVTLAKAKADQSLQAVYVSLETEVFWVRPVAEFAEKFQLLNNAEAK